MNFSKAKRRMSSAEPSSQKLAVGQDPQQQNQNQQQTHGSRRTLHSVLSEDNINRSINNNNSSSVNCATSSSTSAVLSWPERESASRDVDSKSDKTTLRCDKPPVNRQMVPEESGDSGAANDDEMLVIPAWPTSKTDAVALGVSLDPTSIQHHVFSLKNYSQVSVPGPAARANHSNDASQYPLKSIHNPPSNVNLRNSQDHQQPSTITMGRKESLSKQQQHQQQQQAHSSQSGSFLGESRMNRMRKLFVSPLSLRSQNSTSTPSEHTSGYTSSSAASHSAELAGASGRGGGSQAQPTLRPLAYPSKHHHLMSRPSSRKQALKAAGAKQYRVYGCPLQLANNIYPITSFGSRATECYKQQSVPYVLARLCNYIEENSSHLTHEGIFRVSGNARLMEKLRTLFDRLGDAPLESESVDVATSASMLKMYLRELPDPLIPTRMNCYFFALAKKYFPSSGAGHAHGGGNAGNSSSTSSSSTTLQNQQHTTQSGATTAPYNPLLLTNSTIFTSGGGSQHFMSSADRARLEAFSRDLAKLIRKLPVENYNLLRYLACFLYRVSLKQKYNKMCAEALGIVFGPNVFRIRGESYKNLKEQELSNQIMASIISNYKAVFDSEITDPLGNLVSLADESGSPAKQAAAQAVASPVAVERVASPSLATELEPKGAVEKPTKTTTTTVMPPQHQQESTSTNRKQDVDATTSCLLATSTPVVASGSDAVLQGGVESGGDPDEEEQDDEDEELLDEEDESYTSSDSASGSYCSSGSESLMYSYDDEDEDEDDEEEDEEDDEDKGDEDLRDNDDDDENNEPGNLGDMARRVDRGDRDHDDNLSETDLSSTDCDASTYTPTSSASLMDDRGPDEDADDEELDADEESYGVNQLTGLHQDSLELASGREVIASNQVRQALLRQQRPKQPDCKECRRRASIIHERRASMATGLASTAAVAAAAAAEAATAEAQDAPATTLSAAGAKDQQTLSASRLKEEKSHSKENDARDLDDFPTTTTTHTMTMTMTMRMKEQQKAGTSDSANQSGQSKQTTRSSKQRGNVEKVFLGRRSSSASSLGRIKTPNRHHPRLNQHQQQHRDNVTKSSQATRIRAQIEHDQRLRSSTHKRRPHLLAGQPRRAETTSGKNPPVAELMKTSSSQRHAARSSARSATAAAAVANRNVPPSSSRRKLSTNGNGEGDTSRQNVSKQAPMRLQCHQDTFDAMMEASGWPQIHEQELQQQFADYANCATLIHEDLMVAYVRRFHSDETLFRSANFYTEFGDQLDSIVLNNESRRRFSGYDFICALERLNLVSLGAFSPIGEQTFETIIDNANEDNHNGGEAKSKKKQESAAVAVASTCSHDIAAYEHDTPQPLQASLVSLLAGCDSSRNSTAGSGCGSHISNSMGLTDVNCPPGSRPAELNFVNYCDSTLTVDDYKSLGDAASSLERERNFQQTFKHLSSQMKSFQVLVNCLREIANFLQRDLKQLQCSKRLEDISEDLLNLVQRMVFVSNNSGQQETSQDGLPSRFADGSIGCQVDHLTARAFVDKLKKHLDQLCLMMNGLSHKCSPTEKNIAKFQQLEELIQIRINQFKQIYKHIKHIRNHYKRSHRLTANLKSDRSTPQYSGESSIEWRENCKQAETSSHQVAQSISNAAAHHESQSGDDGLIFHSTPDGMDKLHSYASSAAHVISSPSDSSEALLASDEPSLINDSIHNNTKTKPSDSQRQDEHCDCHLGPICPIEFVFNIERLLALKRQADSRDIKLCEMSFEQLNNEKLDLQKNLLRYERWFGRPLMSINVASHLYQRYQLVKIMKNYYENQTPTTTFTPNEIIGPDSADKRIEPDQ